jgi:hypothetical protein
MSETLEQLRNDWQQAKKAADSLTIDFSLIATAREKEIAAHKRYLHARLGSHPRPR